MSLLSVCQSVAIRTVGEKPSTIFSSTDTFALELQDLANEAARDIAKSYDWQALIKEHTILGDSVTDGFSLPSDYDRMLVREELYEASNFAWGYCRVTDVNEFLYARRRQIYAQPGIWTIYANLIQFVPVPPTGAEAIFPYISKNIVTPSAGTDQTKFNSDNDTFVLSERLLTLLLIWKWKAMKKLDHASEEADYRKAVSEIAGQDRGVQKFNMGSSRLPADIRRAFPYTIGGNAP